jgi:hypothetical protein
MKYKYGAAVLAIKNDFCVEETIQELFRQGVMTVTLMIPERYWFDQSPQSEEDLAGLLKVCVHTGAHAVQRYFVAESKEHTALYTEALYRNYVADVICENPSIDYVLTVDADEFWMPGTLEHIDAIAGPDAPTICLPGIPVLGVPGLPVAGAKDNILVATDRKTRFSWGRSTDGPRKSGTLPVIHFSATRRTLQEVIDKSIKSAHYPDKTYDFDGWIKNVLPYVHVGMKNVHMYKSEVNIWPEVRAWTPEELSAIPTSLHPYLKT